MIESLKDKKIAVLGMGINNKQLAAFLLKKNIPFEILDNWNDPAELTEKINSFDIVFRTPGIPFLSQPIQNAIKQGVQVYSQTKLFFDICPGTIIGVTGTKGKGTTSSLIYEILSASGKKTWLAGNIGKDPFEFIDEITPEDFVVLELSSFQLQDLHKSPHIAVVLDITTDHVNPDLKMSTHYTREEYVQAKSSIIKFQNESDIAVLHPDLPSWFKELGKAKKIIFNPSSASHYKTKLLGAHNLTNISAATEACKALGITESVIAQAVADFEPLAHRMQLLGTKNGIAYVNDSASTNEDSTVAAIKSFSQPLIVILGGSDKGHSYTLLSDEIKNSPHVKGVVLVGDVANRIKETLKDFKGKILTGATTMKEIISQSRIIAQAGDVILLSPAAASFGLFKNYKDRGDQFTQEAMSS